MLRADPRFRVSESPEAAIVPWLFSRCGLAQSSHPRSQVRRSDQYVTRRIAGETIVVPIRAEAAQLDSVYVFNEVGARIWQLVEEGLDDDAITTTLVDEFEVTAERAHEDLAAFLETLRESGLAEGEKGR
jgi:hypothetical protein